MNKMAWVRDISSFYDFIGYVVLRAPNRFPHEDYLPNDEQMTLEKAFSELQNGLSLVEKDHPGACASRKLHDLLNSSLAEYQNGNEVKGAHLLQDLQNLIFKA